MDFRVAVGRTKTGEDRLVSKSKGAAVKIGNAILGELPSGLRVEV